MFISKLQKFAIWYMYVYFWKGDLEMTAGDFYLRGLCTVPVCNFLRSPTKNHCNFDILDK